MVCVVVSSGMNHQGVTFYIRHPKPGRQYWVVCIPQGIHVKRGQIAEMPITPRQPVVLACRRIIMSSADNAGTIFPSLSLGSQLGLSCTWKPCKPCGRPARDGLKRHIGCFADDYLANRFPDAFLINDVHLNANIRLCCTAQSERGHCQKYLKSSFHEYSFVVKNQNSFIVVRQSWLV